MSCGNPNTKRDEQLARQLQIEEDNISSNSNLTKKFQGVYDKEVGIYGFDSVFDTYGNRNLTNKIDEKIIDKPISIKETSIFIDLAPLLLFIIIVFIYYLKTNYKYGR